MCVPFHVCVNIRLINIKLCGWGIYFVSYTTTDHTTDAFVLIH